MSYDVWLEVDTGGNEPVTVEDLGSPTYNIAPMFTEALGHSLRDLDGKTAGEERDKIYKAWCDLLNSENKEKYEAMNPANGWGSHEGATNFMHKLLVACAEHPKAIIRVT